MTKGLFAWVTAVAVTFCLSSNAQTATDLPILRGLAPVTALAKTDAGRAALGANYVVTGGIQNGSIALPMLLPFAEQQQQALRDEFITQGNLSQLSDGLGTTLGSAYLARAHYIDGKTFTSISPALASFIRFASGTPGRHSNSSKFFFANGTIDGTKPVSSEATSILSEIGGSPDPFGRAYNLPAGAAGAGKYGNARPFQTEPALTRITGHDYFNNPADNFVYSRGPMTDLTNNPSYPSGHATYGYTGALLFALLVPERYQQMLARGAEYSNGRIMVGAHYAMDVVAARTLALYDMAHLLANDPTYLARSGNGSGNVKDFRESLKAARAEVVKVLEAACGKPVATCAMEDTSRFNNPAANEAFYLSTQTYALPVVFPQNVGVLEDVGTLAPEAGYLLTAAFPSLSLEQANKILTETEGPGGGFLDDGKAFGVYSRINLYAAAGRVLQAISHR